MNNQHPDIGQVEDRLAAFVRQRRRTMQRYFSSIGMFNGHPAMLFHLRRQPGITQKELAGCMEISKACVATSVRRLEAAGLIRREGDPVDGRVTHLYLTPAGEEMDAACARGRDFLIETLYQGLTEEETAALYTALDKMIRNLQAAAATLPEPPQGKDE